MLVTCHLWLFIAMFSIGNAYAYNRKNRLVNYWKYLNDHNNNYWDYDGNIDRLIQLQEIKDLWSYPKARTMGYSDVINEEEEALEIELVVDFGLLTGLIDNHKQPPQTARSVTNNNGNHPGYHKNKYNYLVLEGKKVKIKWPKLIREQDITSDSPDVLEGETPIIWKHYKYLFNEGYFTQSVTNGNFRCDFNQWNIPGNM